jgi:hypothetical protein
MFTQKITESDAFLAMPLSAQAFYFHLCMNADDDGFVKNPKMLAKLVGASEDDFKLLVMKSFVIMYDTGVIVIKHWRMHNILRKDRYTKTTYIEERNQLYLKENGAYTLDETKGEKLSGNQMATKWQPVGNPVKDSIGKDSIEKEKGTNVPKKKTVYFPDNEELENAFQEFLTMRTKIKKPLATKQAVTRMLNKIEKLSSGDNDLAIKILNQSTDHCWQDVYELKDDSSPKKNVYDEWSDA